MGRSMDEDTVEQDARALLQRVDPQRRGFVDIIIRPATREERQLHA